MTAAEKASRLLTTLAQYVVTSAHRKVRQHSDHLIGEFLVSATGDQCLLSVTDARVVRASITRSCSVARVTRHLHGGATSWLWAKGAGRLGAQASRGRCHSCSGETDRLHAGDGLLVRLGDESFAHSGNELPACSRCSREESLAC